MALSAPLSYVDRDRVSVGNSLDDPVPVRVVGEGGVVGTEVQVVNEVEVKNDVNAPLNVAAASLPLPTGAATEAKQLPDNHQVQVSNFPATQVVSGSVNAAVTGSVNVLNQLVPQAFSQIDLTYNLDGTVATAIYKQGATTVATLTLSYTLGRLTSVVRS